MKISRKTSAGQGLLVSLFIIAALVLSACAPAVVGTNPDGYTVVGTNDSGKACKDRGGQTIALNNGSVVTCGGADNSTAPTPTDKQTTEAVGDAPSPDEAVGDAPSPDEAVGDERIVELNYDETGGDTLATGQNRLIANYLRDAMGKNGTQKAMEEAIKAIQAEASSAKATVVEGTSLTLSRDNAWLVWASNATGVTEPTDLSDVFGSNRTGAGKVWIVVPFAPGVPLPTKNTFSSSTGVVFWAVAVK